MQTDASPLAHLMQPIRIGNRMVRNRLLVTPHGVSIGSLFGTEAEAKRNVDYWASRAQAGAGWVGGLSGFLDNLVPPGFEPGGIGARVQGIFRRPDFLDRAGRYAESVQAAGALATCQMIMQGGMPHGPTQLMSGPTINSAPHALTAGEIQWFVEEYRYSAQRAREAGLDGIEIHANHDDLMEWFLSPRTNRREDEYGGSVVNRMRFLEEVVAGIREATTRDFIIGVRFNVLEAEAGGYDDAEGIEIARRLDRGGIVNYLHCVIGSPWGDPSYVQSNHVAQAPGAPFSAAIKATVKIPVVCAGKVNDLDIAERIIAENSADLVGIARAFLVERDLIAKSLAGDRIRIRPCIGCNECLARGFVEALPFACPVNPAVGSWDELPAPAAAPRRILVVGGGVAGMECAATAAERGHDVTLWERAERLGGQALLAAMLPDQEIYAAFLDVLGARLEEAGVDIRTNMEASADAILAQDFDTVVIATGGKARRPAIEGANDDRVLDPWQILTGTPVSGKVALIVQDDHIAPLALADRLSAQDLQVTLFHQTNAPAPLLSRYTLGTILGRLSRQGVKLVPMEETIRIDLPTIVTRNIYSGLETRHTGFDSAVLACGASSDDVLYKALLGRVADLHCIGDAYAPRRMVTATRQGHALARTF